MAPQTPEAQAPAPRPDTTLQTLGEHACFGGVQGFYSHHAPSIGLPMRFGVYQPPQARQGPVPALVWLAGLTCNEETFAIKAGAQRVAAELGLMLVTPDTSPRHTGLEGAGGADAAWDFGTGAGFYLDATQAPWARHWRMESYVTQDLLAALARHFPLRTVARAGGDAGAGTSEQTGGSTGQGQAAVGLFGHSMGGHGALTLGLRHPALWKSVSAIAPIAAPMQCPWGVKAFSGYLGDDRSRWAAHDATELVKSGARLAPGAPYLLVDQGEADKFLAEQLHPHLFEAACHDAGLPLLLRRHTGCDHGYYFIASVVEDHLRHHAAALA